MIAVDPTIVIQPGQPTTPRLPDTDGPGMIGGDRGPGGLDVAIDRDGLVDPRLVVDHSPKPAAPLALLPMRVEYRFVSSQLGSVVRNDADLLGQQDALIKDVLGNNRARQRKAQQELDGLRRAAMAQPRFEPLPGNRDELWVRWYPDSDFARNGIAPPTGEELVAVSAFRAAVGTAQWWLAATPEVSAAWQTLAGIGGPARALHLLRPDAPTADAEPLLGRIAALPQKVALYAVAGTSAQLIAEGTAIPANTAQRSLVSYTQEALEPGGWLASFDMAVSQGMGLKISDPAKIAEAEQAEWLVAVGLHVGDARSELDELFADTVASGRFAFLRQDSPTNNTLGERTPYRSWRDSPQEFLEAATDLERRRHDDGVDGAAELLATALGLDPTVLRRAINSGDTAFEDARAMLRAIGPALLDGALDGRTAFEGIDENAMVDVLAAYVCARGPLSAMMLGSNAYGVLPVTLNAQAALGEVDGFSKTEASVLSRLNQIATFIVPLSAQRAAAGGAPTLNPDRPEETAQQFERLLQNARTAQRVELLDETGEVHSIGCPHVLGVDSAKKPSAYLKSLRSQALSQLPDPDADERTWPLLYRLARLTMTRNVAKVLGDAGLLMDVKSLHAFEMLPKAKRTEALLEFEAVAGEFGLTSGLGASRRVGRSAPGRIAPAQLAFGQRLFAAFDKALARLEVVAARPNGVAELEALMMEVFDLFQHRVDALMTGVAYARLQKQRKGGGVGLFGGYYGMLGKLRRASNPAGSDGYIQAPGMAQATTSAILRSAHLRHRSGGAFNLDLSSKRVRRAMALLELMASGAGLPAAIGLRAERLLRELPRNASHTIPLLRRAFPIQNLAGPDPAQPSQSKAAPAGTPILDGLALLNARSNTVPRAAAPSVDAIRPRLADDLDALSDVIMAEAVHHRAMGAVETANAWLQVLSGGHVPGKPVFLRTQRVMQASSHRVSLVVPQAEIPLNPLLTSPRRSAEPGLAALADLLSAAHGGPDPAFKIKATLVADPARKASLKLRLRTDLGMEPIDLMIGGQSELNVRAQWLLAEKWRADDPATAALGPIAADQTVSAIAKVELDLGSSGAGLGGMLARLEALRQVAGQGRPIEPSDLANAADAALGTIAAADEAAALRSAADALTARAKALASALDSAQSKVGNALSGLRSRLLALVNELDFDPLGSAAMVAWIAARTALANLSAELPRLASCGAPQVLASHTAEALLTDAAPLARIEDAVGRIAKAVANLRSFQPMTGGEDSTAARGAVAALRGALQAATDGEALPILPPYPTAVATLKPLVDAPTALPGGFAELNDWAVVRALIGGAKRAVGDLVFLSRYAVLPGATIAPGDLDDDERSEAEAPPSRHYGIFLSDRKLGGDDDALAGIVVDEWAESRPSSQQDAALAVNYNTPDAQAPNAILLCVSPDSNWRSWNTTGAARMVGAVIQQMQARALSSDLRLVQTTLSEDSNRVPFKIVGNRGVKRIPERQLKFGLSGLFNISGLFVEVSAMAPDAHAGLRAAGMAPIAGFTTMRSE